ncbi:MAG: hypothetical protein BWX80_02905 [Candidatus Hydrogenedentes bacterium ADurb.Bin101]|nr:MAG: hypothetical protein BWX80_02905 [Candidatus Hydrogenedentes bacterium ADurb.Bin101]
MRGADKKVFRVNLSVAVRVFVEVDGDVGDARIASIETAVAVLVFKNFISDGTGADARPARLVAKIYEVGAGVVGKGHARLVECTAVRIAGVRMLHETCGCGIHHNNIHAVGQALKVIETGVVSNPAGNKGIGPGIVHAIAVDIVIQVYRNPLNPFLHFVLDAVTIPVAPDGVANRAAADVDTRVRRRGHHLALKPHLEVVAVGLRRNILADKDLEGKDERLAGLDALVDGKNGLVRIGGVDGNERVRQQAAVNLLGHHAYISKTGGQVFSNDKGDAVGARADIADLNGIVYRAAGRNGRGGNILVPYQEIIGAGSDRVVGVSYALI